MQSSDDGGGRRETPSDLQRMRPSKTNLHLPRHTIGANPDEHRDTHPPPPTRVSPQTQHHTSPRQILTQRHHNPRPPPPSPPPLLLHHRRRNLPHDLPLPAVVIFFLPRRHPIRVQIPKPPPDLAAEARRVRRDVEAREGDGEGQRGGFERGGGREGVFGRGGGRVRERGKHLRLGAVFEEGACRRVREHGGGGRAVLGSFGDGRGGDREEAD